MDYFNDILPPAVACHVTFPCTGCDESEMELFELFPLLPSPELVHGSDKMLIESFSS